MAISKERLEELIKEGATIYSLDEQVKYPIPIFLKDGENAVVNDNELVNSVRVIDKIENLYETQKQAEWSLNYQHATRTEELNLPMWEEIITDDKYKYHYGLSFFDFDNYRLIVCVPNEDDNTEFIGIDVDGNTELYHWDEATEENYIKACDLCLKLFKGN